MSIYEQEWYKEHENGYMARLMGKQFDDAMSDSWKRGWKSADKEAKLNSIALLYYSITV